MSHLTTYDTGDLIRVPACLSKERVVVLDVETTGFDRKKDRVIEFGAIWIESGEFIMDFSRILNPGRDIPDEIVELTGITNKQAHKANPFSSIVEFVVDLLESPAVIVAYNSSFDLSFLRHEIERNGEKINKIGTVIDPLKWVRDEDRGMKCKLGLAAERRGIDSSGAHRALDDCYITLLLMNELRNLKRPKNLKEALDAQGKLRSNNSYKGRRR